MLPVQVSTQNLSGLGESQSQSAASDQAQVTGDKSFSDVLATATGKPDQTAETSPKELTAEQLEAIKQYMADGKSLPEAAKIVLGEAAKSMSAKDFAKLEATLAQAQQAQTQVQTDVLPADVSEEALSAEVLPDEEAPLEDLPKQSSEQSAEAELEQQDNEVSAEALLQAEAKATQAKQAKPEEAEQPNSAAARNERPASIRSAEVARMDKPVEPAEKTQKPGEAVDGKSVEAKIQLPSVAAQSASNEMTGNMSGGNHNPGYSAASQGIPGGTFSAPVAGPASSGSFTQIMAQTVPQPVTQNLHGPEWGGAVGERVLWMMNKDVQSAQLRIKPAHLGPIEISIKMDKDHAHVSFTSSHPVVRDALEQSVPKLREMFSQQNIDLADVNVHDQQTADNSRQQAASKAANDLASWKNSGELQEEADDLPSTTAQVVSSAGLVDAYA